MSCSSAVSWAACCMLRMQSGSQQQKAASAYPFCPASSMMPHYMMSCCQTTTSRLQAHMAASQRSALQHASCKDHAAMWPVHPLSFCAVSADNGEVVFLWLCLAACAFLVLAGWPEFPADRKVERHQDHSTLGDSCCWTMQVKLCSVWNCAVVDRCA
jgi:hypothetical protein